MALLPLLPASPPVLLLRLLSELPHAKPDPTAMMTVVINQTRTPVVTFPSLGLLDADVSRRCLIGRTMASDMEDLLGRRRTPDGRSALGVNGRWSPV
jgi:hypothetical protein